MIRIILLRNKVKEKEFISSHRVFEYLFWFSLFGMGHNSTRRSAERKKRTELQLEREKLARNAHFPSSLVILIEIMIFSNWI